MIHLLDWSSVILICVTILAVKWLADALFDGDDTATEIVTKPGDD